MIGPALAYPVSYEVEAGQEWTTGSDNHRLFRVTERLPGKYLRPPDVAIIPCEFCHAVWLTGPTHGQEFELRTPGFRLGGEGHYRLFRAADGGLTDFGFVRAELASEGFKHTSVGHPPSFHHPSGSRTRPGDDEWRLTDDLCLITRDAYDRLLAYDCSMPTGTYIGKVWKRRDRDGEWLGEYVADPEEPFKRYLVRWRRLLIAHPVGGVLVPSDLPWKGYAA